MAKQLASQRNEEALFGGDNVYGNTRWQKMSEQHWVPDTLASTEKQVLRCAQHDNPKKVIAMRCWRHKPRQASPDRTGRSPVPTRLIAHRTNG